MLDNPIKDDEITEQEIRRRGRLYKKCNSKKC
jgi:hypothetical protein